VLPCHKAVRGLHVHFGVPPLLESPAHALDEQITLPYLMLLKVRVGVLVRAVARGFPAD
jgi:hypothetical protein